MTKPAQFLLVIFALFFISAGFINISGKDYFSFTTVEGNITQIECPRKYSVKIKLSTSDKEYYLADKFKTVSGCREKTKAENLLGELAHLTVAQNGDVTSVKLNSKIVYSSSDVKYESARNGVISLLIGVAFLVLLFYKRNAT